MRRSLLATLFLALALVPFITQAVGVSPSVLEVSGQPGESVRSFITILNSNARDQVYYLDVLGLSAGEDEGTPVFFEPPAGDDVTDWINFPSSAVTVPLMSSAQVPFTISIPDSVPSGGYYLAITVSQAPSDIVQANGAIVEAKTAILVFLTVLGDTKEILGLLDFSGPAGVMSVPSTTFMVRVQNQGNVHLTPSGTVDMRNMFGREIAKVEMNADGKRILPKTTRSFETVYSAGDGWFETVAYQFKNLAFGPVTATLNMTYGSVGVLESEIHFWLFPWQLILTVGVPALVLILMLLRLKKH